MGPKSETLRDEFIIFAHLIFVKILGNRKKIFLKFTYAIPVHRFELEHL